MSCSVDNTIIIWDTTTFTVKEQLSGHTGMVKGVVWDPVSIKITLIIFVCYTL